MPAKKTFDKPALTIDQQIDLLEKRGLYVEDKSFAYKAMRMYLFRKLSGTLNLIMN